MQRTRFLLASALALLLVLFPASAGISRAATVRVTPVLSELIRDDFISAVDWTPDGAGGALIEPGQGGLFARIDFTVKIEGLAGSPREVGFGNVVFDIELADGISDLSGWINGPRVDHDSFHCFPQPFPLPCIPKFADNGDMGTSRDLIDIVVGVAPRAFRPDAEDPRRTIGQSSPETMGFIFAAFDTGTPNNHAQVAAIVKAFSTWDADLLLARNHGRRFGGTVNLRVVPEPVAFLLLLMGFVCLAANGRTPFFAA